MCLLVFCWIYKYNVFFEFIVTKLWCVGALCPSYQTLSCQILCRSDNFIVSKFNNFANLKSYDSNTTKCCQGSFSSQILLWYILFEIKLVEKENNVFFKNNNSYVFFLNWNKLNCSMQVSCRFIRTVDLRFQFPRTIFNWALFWYSHKHSWEKCKHFLENNIK